MTEILKFWLAWEVILAQGDDGTFAILIASGCCTVEVNGTKVGEVQARGECQQCLWDGQWIVIICDKLSYIITIYNNNNISLDILICIMIFPDMQCSSFVQVYD